MRFTKTITTYVLMLISGLVLISWGNAGHVSIADHISLSFNDEMQPFNDWVSYIADHSSDADYRKSDDPDEGVRHYIDIDDYPEFVSNGKISQSLDEMIATHGYSKVYNIGVLPWATLNTYDSLVACLQRHDWEKSKYFAADLSHYVGDGHMPLHITSNYDGRQTNNSGIHSRYESDMINAHVQEVTFTGKPVNHIDNISQYVFNYLYANYPYVDSILKADDYAKTFSTSTSSTEYKDALWNKTRDFTGLLLNNASHALAELIYNAWLESGKPTIDGTDIPASAVSSVDINVFPNPGYGNTEINFNLNYISWVQVEVYDLTGKRIATLCNKKLQSDTYHFNWGTQEQPSGIYMVKLTTDKESASKKLIIAR